MQNDLLPLLGRTYSGSVEELLKKYGPARDDYFSQASYERFMRGEVKAPSKKRSVSRTSDGLYCHHVDEIFFPNISQPDFIKYFEIPFDSQRADRLVYCHLLEHAELHCLISTETEGRLGLPGYVVFLRPQLIEWYVTGHEPESGWKKKCFRASYLTPQNAVSVIDMMDEFLLSRIPDLTRNDLSV